MLVKIVATLTVVIIVLIGGYLTYNTAYTFGASEGYGKGYPAGQQVGFNDGQQEGYNQGREAGYSSGYTEGSATGEKKGFASGYASGDKDGYGRGYLTGEKEGYQEGMAAGLGHGYTLKDPTYAGAIAFLERDQTDRYEYIEGKYVCSHFARDFDNNAESAGIRCAFVELRYGEGGHTIIAFNTVDHGLVYFEPQSDEAVRPVIGKRFYQCIEPKPGYYYNVPSFDDTILDILVIW